MTKFEASVIAVGLFKEAIKEAEEDYAREKSHANLAKLDSLKLARDVILYGPRFANNN